MAAFANSDAQGVQNELDRKERMQDAIIKTAEDVVIHFTDKCYGYVKALETMP